MNRALSRRTLNVLLFWLILAGGPPALAVTPTPVHDHYAAPGPWQIAVDAVTYASGQTGVLYRPTGGAGDVFPVVVWGNGSDAEPELNYPELLRLIASHGYVVTATNHREVGTGEPLLESLDYLHTVAADPLHSLYGKVDFDAVAAVGHSQGAGGSTRAVVNSSAIHTLVPLALPRPIFVFELEKQFDVSAVDVPVFIIGAVGDLISDTDTVRAYFDEIPDAAVMAMVADSPAPFPHVEWSFNAGGVSRAYIIAWLDYILRDDVFAAGAFTGQHPELAMHPEFTAVESKCLAGGELPLATPVDSSVIEGNSGSRVVAVEITLAYACNRPVSLDWATVDTLVQPVAGVDYEAAAGRLEIPAGQGSGKIPLRVYGDTLFEGWDAEHAVIDFYNPENARLDSAPGSASAILAIQNDDPPPGC